jgi:hypothetical protein
MDSKDAARKEAEEALRRIAQDYQEVFGTEQGARVLHHLNGLLCMRRKLSRAPGQDFPANEAIYIAGRRDAALEIDAILTHDFRKPTAPVVRTSRFKVHQPIG